MELRKYKIVTYKVIIIEEKIWKDFAEIYEYKL